MTRPQRLPVNGKPGRDQRQMRIIDHAKRIFLAQGYHGTNIEDIAIAASVSKMTIYDYFGDKAGLAAEVLRNAAMQLMIGCRGTLKADAPVEEVLTRFAARYIGCMVENVGDQPFFNFSRLLMEVSYQRPDIAGIWNDVLMSEVGEPLQAYMQKLIDRRIVAVMDARLLAAHFFQSLLDGDALVFCAATGNTFVQPPAPHQIAEVAALKVQLFLNGACPTSPGTMLNAG
jgi:TetR/AcrR family transcriptional repressor of mexJK operon